MPVASTPTSPAMKVKLALPFKIVGAAGVVATVPPEAFFRVMVPPSSVAGATRGVGVVTCTVAVTVPPTVRMFGDKGSNVVVEVVRTARLAVCSSPPVRLDAAYQSFGKTRTVG